MSEERRVTRRDALMGAGAIGAVGAAASLAPAARAAGARAAGKSRLPIEHIVVDCQENRSFDHYYGFAPWIKG
jgi:phospholipase C